MTSILDGAETHSHDHSPKGTTDVNDLNLPDSDLASDAPGSIRKVTDTVTGVASKAKDTISSAAGTVNVKVRRHGPTAVSHAKRIGAKGLDTAKSAAQSDITKKAVRHNGVRTGALGLVIVAIVVVVAKRRARG